MKKRYENILKPLVWNGVVLKNRTAFPVAPVHFLVGNEDQPNDAYITFHANLARAGAAYIHLNEWNNPEQHTFGLNDSLHMPQFDTDRPGTWNYICQLCDAIHYYGSKALMSVAVRFPAGYSLYGGVPMSFPGLPPRPALKPAPKEMLQGVIDDYIERVRQYKLSGVDMIACQFMFAPNPMNQREDEYGNATLDDRIRFTKELLTRVKKEFGKGFLVESIIAGEEDGRFTTEELIEAAKKMEGLIDIYTLREKNVVASHPTGFTFAQIGDHKVMEYAKKMKAAGVNAIISINGGFQDADEIEKYLADGVCDMVSIGRGFFADPDWLRKVKEGRGEDITPCIWCNKCHGVGFSGPWLVFCSVNPKMGIETKARRLEEPMTRKKKVAVIGGGPIGMREAIFLAERGHEPVIFEKSGKLGGQLDFADHMAFKWPIRDYRDWMSRQIEKLGIRVELGRAPEPEELSEAGFDAVVVAAGAVPNIPDIKGLRKDSGELAEHVYTIPGILGHEAELGERIVLVGASDSGIEAAIHLAQKGKEVWSLTRREEIAMDANRPHGITMTWIDPKLPGMLGCRPEWEKYPNMHNLTLATTTEIGPGYVKYIDKDGAEQTIACDDVVISGGMNKNIEGALKYQDAAPDFYMIGDCSDYGGDLRRGNREAWAVANQL